MGRCAATAQSLRDFRGYGNRFLWIRLNIEMALKNGATRGEILETILHMAFYAGFPACWDALVIADEVFNQNQASRP